MHPEIKYIFSDCLGRSRTSRTKRSTRTNRRARKKCKTTTQHNVLCNTAVRWWMWTAPKTFFYIFIWFINFLVLDFVLHFVVIPFWTLYWRSLFKLLKYYVMSYCFKILRNLNWFFFVVGKPWWLWWFWPKRWPRTPRSKRTSNVPANLKIFSG